MKGENMEPRPCDWNRPEKIFLSEERKKEFQALESKHMLNFARDCNKYGFAPVAFGLRYLAIYEAEELKKRDELQRLKNKENVSH